VVVALPDGRVQTTNYNADFYNGYVADVKYEGTPTYPPEKQETYNGPKFIPVHMKARTTHQKQPVPSKFKFQNFPYREQQRPSKLASEETSQRISFQTEKINSINSFTSVNTPSQSSMAEIMDKVRKDLKKLEKLRINPEQHQQVSFQNGISTSSGKMNEMRKKNRNNVGNQQLSPMMKIKSHVMPGPKDKMAQIIKQMNENRNKNKKENQMMSIKSHVINPMSIKSHVISSPPPVESMAEIMKKIREDLARTNTVELPPSVMNIQSDIQSQGSDVTENMMDIIQQIRMDLQTNEKLVIGGKERKITQIPTKKPIRVSVIDFMKKIELMKKKEKTTSPAMMSVKSRVIQQTNQDSNGNVSMRILSHVIPEPEDLTW